MAQDVFPWESTKLGDLPNVESGEEHKGVRLVLLLDVVRRYQGSIVLRRLNHVRSAGAGDTRT